MAIREATPIALTAEERAVLEGWVRAPTSEQRLVERARHVEIQVFGFGDGTAVHLFERDCSLQRRHQKVIEEARAPLISEPVRAAMAQAAVALAQH